MATEMKQKLSEVNGQITEQKQVTQSKWSAFEEAREKFAKAGEDANNTESEAFKEMDAVNKEYSVEAEKLTDLEAVRDGVFRAMSGEGPASPEEAAAALKSSTLVRPDEFRSLGSKAVESDAYKELKASGALDSDHAKFNAVLGERGSTDELRSALLTGADDASAGAFVVNDRKGYVPQPQRPRTILDLITTGSTDSDIVEFVRQQAFSNVAAEVAEATTTATGTKPEASLAFEIVQATAKNIAHWVPSTRRALADAGQLRTIVDAQLRYGLEYRLEGQVVSGDGAGENLKGILNTSGILTQAKGSDSIADAIHKAITKIRLGFLEPNGVALHPNDWEVVRLSRDDSGATAGTGGYLYGPPSTAGAEQMWGKPVAVSAAVPDDTGLVGDFRFATLWLREGIQVLASDSHSDFFVKNLIAVLAEMRAAFGVQLPAAFCKVTSLD